MMRPGTIPTVLLSPSVNVHCRPKASREIKPRCLCPITRQVPPPPPHVRKFPGWTLRRQKLSLPLSLPPSPSLPPSLAPFLPRSLFPPSSVRPSLPPSVPVPPLSVCLSVCLCLTARTADDNCACAIGAAAAYRIPSEPVSIQWSTVSGQRRQRMTDYAGRSIWRCRQQKTTPPRNRTDPAKAIAAISR